MWTRSPRLVPAWRRRSTAPSIEPDRPSKPGSTSGARPGPWWVVSVSISPRTVGTRPARSRSWRPTRWVSPHRGGRRGDPRSPTGGPGVHLRRVLHEDRAGGVCRVPRVLSWSTRRVPRANGRDTHGARSRPGPIRPSCSADRSAGGQCDTDARRGRTPDGRPPGPPVADAKQPLHSDDAASPIAASLIGHGARPAPSSLLALVAHRRPRCDVVVWRQLLSPPMPPATPPRSGPDARDHRWPSSPCPRRSRASASFRRGTGRPPRGGPRRPR